MFAMMTVNAQWQVQDVKTDASFRGLAVVSDKVVWASGTKGTFVKTTDGGKNWMAASVPDADKLDFRDVEAFDANTAYLLSIGNGDLSRIYKTTDGGKTWALQFKNENPKAFFDAMAFWDKEHGIAMSDPVDGKILLITTKDGGKHWTPLPAESLPQALPGEAMFAASGTCIMTRGKSNLWIATGGAASRVHRSTDRGRTWSVATTPIITGEAAGIFSIAFRNDNEGIIVGGDYKKPNEAKNNVAVTKDGGKTWTLVEAKGLGGYRSAVTYAATGKVLSMVAAGTSGSDISISGGNEWMSLDKANYNSVVFTNQADVGWAVGPNGRVAKFVRNDIPDSKR
ncbi:MAG: glycosyl hydrolase [Acidobacteriota bacterium]